MEAVAQASHSRPLQAMEVGATAPGCELGPVPPGKAHDWACGGTQHHKAKGHSGCCSPTVSPRVPVLRRNPEHPRAWGAAFGPAPCSVLPTEMLVGAVLATTEVPRALHKGRQADQGQEGARTCCQGAGLLPGPCSDPNLMPTNNAAFRSQICNERLKKKAIGD